MTVRIVWYRGKRGGGLAAPSSPLPLKMPVLSSEARKPTGRERENIKVRRNLNKV